MINLLRKCLFLIGERRRRRWIALMVLAVLVSVIEAVAASLLFLLLSLISSPTSQALDTVVPLPGFLTRSPTNDQLVFLAVFIAAFFLMRGGVYAFQSYAQNRMAFNTGSALALRLLHGYVNMPYAFHLRRNSSELIRNAHEATHLFSYLILLPAMTLLSEGLMAVAILAVLIVAAPGTTLLAMAILAPPLLVLLKLTQPHLHRLGLLGQETLGTTVQALQETLHGFRDIKVLGREAYFEARFLDTREAMARAFYSRAVLVEAPRLVLETCLLLFLTLFLALQGVLGPSAEVLPSLGLFGYAALRLLPSLNRTMNNVQSLRFGRPLINTLVEEATMADAAVREVERTTVHASIPFTSDIALRDVYFRYDGERAEALSGVSLVIRRGESIGIVGPTGCGKSTLVDVMLGLLEPTSGVVEVDRQDIAAGRAAWHAHLGVVPQNVFLLDDTMRRNVAFGFDEDEIDDARVTRAIAQAQLDEFVASLPKGLETVVGERGVALSGGQRQRIAIARALYREPDVLIFDEGTSALDSQTEANLLDAIDQLRGDRTIVTIAHRLTTVKYCDRVVLMSQGRIVDVGHFDDLVERNADFRSLAFQTVTAQRTDT